MAVVAVAVEVWVACAVATEGVEVDAKEGVALEAMMDRVE